MCMTDGAAPRLHRAGSVKATYSPDLRFIGNARPAGAADRIPHVDRAEGAVREESDRRRGQSGRTSAPPK